MYVCVSLLLGHGSDIVVPSTRNHTLKSSLFSSLLSPNARHALDDGQNHLFGTSAACPRKHHGLPLRRPDLPLPEAGRHHPVAAESDQRAEPRHHGSTQHQARLQAQHPVRLLRLHLLPQTQPEN